MYTTYTGARVRIRPFKDWDEVKRINFEQFITPNEFWGPQWFPFAIAKRFFEETGYLGTSGMNLFAVDRLDTGELVGSEIYGARRNEINGISASLGTEIMPEHRHMGFGIEAKQLCICFLFENFPLEKVYADTTNIHAPAVRGLKACGMHYEGANKCLHYKDGTYHHKVYFTIYREEWECLPIRQIVKRG